MTIAKLYEEGFVEWAAKNAELLRAGRFEEADIDHIAEEIEDMGQSRRIALEKNYQDAVRVAAFETNLPKPVFPPACPYTAEQILHEEFLP